MQNEILIKSVWLDEFLRMQYLIKQFSNLVFRQQTDPNCYAITLNDEQFLYLKLRFNIHDNKTIDINDKNIREILDYLNNKIHV